MEHDVVKQSIAYCGLICQLCFLAAKCDGCRTVNNQCERNCSDQDCFQKNCCAQKGFEGCWQCRDLQNCTQGIYQSGDYSKIKAFAICIREDGLDAFVRYVLKNMEKGLSVEKGKDYDGKSVSAVLNMLRSGNESRIMH